MDEFVENTGINPCTGNEPGRIVDSQSGLFFDFDVDILRTLLSRSGALGLRLHFDQFRPLLPTDLWVAAAGEIQDIRDNQFDNQAYFNSSRENRSRVNLPEQVRFNFKAFSKASNDEIPFLKLAGSAFFSRAILERPTMLGPASKPSNSSKIRFFVKEAGPDCIDSEDRPYLTLVAIGVEADGTLNEPYVMSEQPCPPNCPTGDE